MYVIIDKVTILSLAYLFNDDDHSPWGKLMWYKFFSPAEKGLLKTKPILESCERKIRNNWHRRNNRQFNEASVVLFSHLLSFYPLYNMQKMASIEQHIKHLSPIVCEDCGTTMESIIVNLRAWMALHICYIDAIFFVDRWSRINRPLEE